MARLPRALKLSKLVVISGCSGGGKSTLVAELRRRGHQVIDEPGRRIVRDQLATGDTALPWVDMQAFVRRLIDLSLEDRRMAEDSPHMVFFDRGLVDAVADYRHFIGRDEHVDRLCTQYPYGPKVFFAAPWPELFESDSERKHGFDDALAEYRRLASFYPSLGYHVTLLPRVSVAERADFVLTEVERQG